MGIIKNITNGLIYPVFEFKLRLPIWMCILIIFLPLMAYGDVVSFGKHNFITYLGICAVEIFLIYLGFMIAYFTKIMEQKE